MSLGALSRESPMTVLAVRHERSAAKEATSWRRPVRFARFPAPLRMWSGRWHSPTLPHDFGGLRNGGHGLAFRIKADPPPRRFGGTPAYLRSGRQLEIKVARGPSPAKAAASRPEVDA